MNLKFRVWDKLTERYIYPDHGYQGHFTITLNGKFFNLQNGSGGDECVIELCTFALDKNGQEIYEGDVLWDEDNECYYEIKWDEDSFCFSKEDGFGFDENLNSLKVVGQTHNFCHK